jgi:oligosaccharide repeat unit polymerase
MIKSNKSDILEYSPLKISVSKRILLLIFLFISIFQLILRPRYGISMGHIYFSFLNVIISTYFYFKFSKKINYLDFETIFIVILLIVGYAYPVLLFDKKQPFIFFFGLNYEVNNLVIGTIIYTIGVQSYFIGSLSVAYKKLKIVNKKKINTFFLSIAVIILSALFILFGGFEHFQDMYTDADSHENRAVLMVMSLLLAFSIVLITTEFYNIKVSYNYKINKIAFISILLIVILMLMAGNRTLATQLILPILVFFAIFKNKIGLKGFIVFISIGIVSMWIIQLFRSGLIIQSPANFAMVISDLVIPGRNNYIAIEYVDKFGYTYGENMLGGLIGAVPSLERILVNIFDFNSRLLGSAEVFTDYSLGSSPSVGLGTTIIADIYISFGVLGVIILMASLGYFTKSQYVKAIQLSYYSMISYAAITSFAVFWVRSTYTNPVRLLLWCFIIAKLNKIMTNKPKII